MFNYPNTKSRNARFVITLELCLIHDSLKKENFGITLHHVNSAFGTLRRPKPETS